MAKSAPPTYTRCGESILFCYSIGFVESIKSAAQRWGVRKKILFLSDSNKFYRAIGLIRDLLLAIDGAEGSLDLICLKILYLSRGN